MPSINTSKSFSVGEIYRVLDEISPFALQESWDNCGLNLGHMQQRVESIALALELDSAMACALPPHTLLITHHPLIFSPLKSLRTDSYPAQLIATLLRKNCALIAMHTNFDHTHLNAHFAQEILGFTAIQEQGIARYVRISPTPLATLATRCKQNLALPHIRYVAGDSRRDMLVVGGDFSGDLERDSRAADFGTLDSAGTTQAISKATSQTTSKAISQATPQNSPSENLIEHVYIVCGSGASFAREIGGLSDPRRSCLITGDIKYHDAMIAKSTGLSLIDVEHYASEREFPKILKSLLQIKNLNATIMPNFSPFSHL